MIEIGQKRGTGLQSETIEYVTDSVWSHTLIRFQCGYEGVNFRNEPVILKPGSIIEAWSPFVRKIDSLAEGHPKGAVVDFFSTKEPITEAQFKLMAKFACRQVGKPYAWKDASARLPLARPFLQPPNGGLTYWQYDEWFCSELAAAMFEEGGLLLFNFWKAWRIEPETVPQSVRLNPDFRTEVVTV